MIFEDYTGQLTSVEDNSHSFNLTKNNVKELVDYFWSCKGINEPWFCNIQIPEENSQFDVFFCDSYINQGFHQRGARANDLLIGILGRGFYAFGKVGDTSQRYYYEKLNVNSELLTLLFNEMRKEL